MDSAANAPSRPNADAPSPAPAIKLFVPPGHFYSPIVNPVEADRVLAALEAAPVPDALPGIALRRADMIAQWERLLPYLKDAGLPQTKTEGRRYAFDNPAYGPGDALVLQAMLRLHRPKRMIEVGSGWSSACAIDTIERHLGGACDFTVIEPYQELLRGLIGTTNVKVRSFECPVQQVPLSIFDQLQSGDILFIDSTHILRTGSDVCFELFEVLPRLARGVLVHIHDMFWPFEYPRAWAVDDNRSWNELYAVRAMLTETRAWRIAFFNDYFGKVERERALAASPDFMFNPGGALWLERE